MTIDTDTLNHKNYSLCVDDIIKTVLSHVQSGKTFNLTKIKSASSNKYKLSNQPKLFDIINAIPNESKSILIPVLKAKPVRTASGIAVVAVMCKPHRCPHIATTGNVCVYCPGGPDSDFEYSTQSYTGYEPTSMRAIRARYDPYIQARHRIAQLQQLGHDVEKIEYIIMGGTFMSLPEDYRDFFIRNLHDALSGARSNSVREAVLMSERSRMKCIGITIETRPDYCYERHINDMLSYGCTRLEIGVQSVYEDIALDTNRGHTVSATCQTFVLAKEAGYKVVTHMMPDLPNMGYRRDLSQFIQLFEDPSFRPDGLKIYPTLVIRGTGLYELWKTGRYKSYPPSVLIDLVSKILALIPPWVRVYRVQRDIPMPLVSSSAVESGNLREHCLARMKELGLTCRDVRTREAGIRHIHANKEKEKNCNKYSAENKRGALIIQDMTSSPTTTNNAAQQNEIELVRRDYVGNEGWETFLSYEDTSTDTLIGLLRLRQCNPVTAYRPELKANHNASTFVNTNVHSAHIITPTYPLDRVSIVRELHVYGSVVPLQAKDPTKFQHQGIGTLLMEEAERIAKTEHGSNKIAVISGVGTRAYYRKLGYELEGSYMTKILF